MCSKVLPLSGLLIVRSSVFPLSFDDQNSDVVKKKIEEFESALAENSIGQTLLYLEALAEVEQNSYFHMILSNQFVQ